MKLLLRVCFLLVILLKVQILCAQKELRKTQIMVLGTYHLNQIKEFNSEMLDNLVVKLNDFNFDAICIEKMPGELLYDIESRNDSAFVELLQYFGGDRLEIAKIAQENLGIGFMEAQTKSLELLDNDKLSEVDRSLLIKYFIASTDLASATLHYRYLENKSILGSSEFEEQIQEKLEKLSKSKNEIYSLALRLAYNRNLQKLEYIDNVQDETLLYKYYPNFTQDYVNNQEQFNGISKLPVYNKVNDLVGQGVESNDLLNLYVFQNSKVFQDQDFEAQWSIWLNTNFSSGSDRARYSLWEMRNLQITANILKIASLYPKKRILVIIGASHKSFIEKYLQQIPDIEITDFN